MPGAFRNILEYIKEAFSLKPKTWDDIEEDDPTPDEIDAINEYHREHRIGTN